MLDALQNAAAISRRVLEHLGGRDGGAGCGSVSLVGDTVTVNFGAPPGCRTILGTEVSGSVSARVSKSGSTLTVDLVFTQVVVNSHDIDGSASFATSTGNVFSVDASLRSDNKMLTTTALTVTGEPGAITVGGMASVTRNATTTAFTFRAVHWKKGHRVSFRNGSAVTRSICTKPPRAKNFSAVVVIRNSDRIPSCFARSKISS